MADEAFHEIQLNGKQLVFLFMASTVVAVVIFLCGIMVGRGVRAQRGELAAAEATTGDPTAGVAPASLAMSGGSPGGASPATRESLTYPGRLGADAAPPETLREPEPAMAGALGDIDPTRRDVKAAPARAPASGPAPPSALSPAAAPATPSSPGPAASSSESPVSSVLTPPAGSGFTVQVGTSNDGAAAERMAQRLAAKGYAAYVTAPAAGGKRIFRVRVGKFKSRSEAESVASRLEKEEQFKPWITR